MRTRVHFSRWSLSLELVTDVARGVMTATMRGFFLSQWPCATSKQPWIYLLSPKPFKQKSSHYSAFVGSTTARVQSQGTKHSHITSKIYKKSPKKLGYFLSPIHCQYLTQKSHF